VSRMAGQPSPPLLGFRARLRDARRGSPRRNTGWGSLVLFTFALHAAHTVPAMAHLAVIRQGPESAAGLYVTVHSPQLTVDVGEPVAPDGPAVAASGAWPNPCRERVRLVFELRRAGRVELSIFDLLGRRVGHIPARVFPAGRWSLDWNGLGAGEERPPSGLYFYRLTLDGEHAAAGKLVVTR